MLKIPAGAVAPVAPERPESHTIHGIERIDPYAWLRAGNWQEMFHDTSLLDPAIRDYLEAENAYQEQVLRPTAPCASA